MGQKKRATAVRTATTNGPASSPQLGDSQVWFIPSTVDDRGKGRASVGANAPPGAGLEIASAENAGGEDEGREASASGKGDIGGKTHGEKGTGLAAATNANGKVSIINSVGGSVSCNGKYEVAISAGARGECERALVALRRGNSTKAIRLIKDACNRNESSGLVHRVQGHICMRLASVIEDPTTKQRHFYGALESAKKAASLSPQSVEYGHFYAQLLYEAAKDSKGYEVVIQECERALLIDDPVDPAKESLHNEQQHELPTPEARIAHVQQELKALVQKANITSISTWMKTLGNGAGEEKLRFIQMRKFSDQDPMEQRISQPKRPHEVKKVVKTAEERRKEIEVRVAAARLLQQRENQPTNTVLELQDEPEKKRLDRRKSSGPTSRRLAKAASMEDRINRLRPFWHALTNEKREALLEVSIAELKEHLGASKEHVGHGKSHAASDALAEALEFAQEKKTWRYWACCKCRERFIDYQEMIHHVRHDHTGILLEKLQQVIPQEIDQDWVEHLLDDDCRPIDGAGAVRMLIESSHLPLPEEPQALETIFLENEDKKELANTDLDTPKESDDSSQFDSKTLETSGDIESGVVLVVDDVENGHSHSCNGECQKVKNVARAAKEMPPQDLPFIENEERRKLLEKIYGLFRVLIRNKCLANDHVMKIIQYATEEVQSLVPDPTVHYEFNNSPLYIRFLEALPLQHIHKYLMELAQACSLTRLSDVTVPPNIGEAGEEETIQDILFLNEDFTQLLLDDRVLKEFSEEILPVIEKFEAGELKQTVNEKGEAARRPPLPLMKGRNGETTTPHMDLQLSWLYGSMDYEFPPLGWKQFREVQAEQATKVCMALEKEFQQLQSFCGKKFELVNYEEALNLAERLCAEENKRREHQAEGTRRSFETILKQRQQELVDARVNGLSLPYKMELDAINNVLRDAQIGMVRRHPYDGTLGVRLSDSDEDEEEAWRMQASMHRADSRVEGVILRQREHLSNEVNHVDAKIMKTMDQLQKLETKLGQSSVLDYRAVVLPLVKSLLKSRLEEEADKDALQKSDAAGEAFLAELAQDKKSPKGKELEIVKQAREKSKDKKKVKDQKKSKDMKRVPTSSVQDSQQRAEDCSVTQEDVDEVDSWDWIEGEDIRLQEEAEIQHQAEMWAEECQLAAALELQRHVEEQAKAKHLAEQERKKLAQEQSLQTEDDGWEFIGSVPSTSKMVNTLSPQKVEISGEMCSQWPLLEFASATISPAVVSTSASETVVAPESTPPLTSLSYAQSILTASSGQSFLRQMGISVECEDQQAKALGDDTMNKSENTEVLVSNPPPASNEVLSLGNGDNLTFSPRKSRGGGSRNRRRRGPRIHAEEGMPVDQEGQVIQSAGSIDGSWPLSGQNDSKCLASPLASGTDETYPLLLLPAPSTAEGGEHESKTLRQLQAEQDDEDRFQADLEQAMRQSLDMLTLTTSNLSSKASRPLCSARSPGSPGASEIKQAEAKGGTSNGVVPVVEGQAEDAKEAGKGLRNEIGQYNCFLNVVIQSLWHLRRFREELLAETSTQHVHVGVPCVVCALRDIFVGLKTATQDCSSKETVAPTALRVALSAMYSDRDFFQEAQMNDASEVLAVIFDCLHKAFVPSASSDGDSESSTTGGSWDCQGQHPCIAHSLFGLDVSEQMNCQGCGLESRHLKYTAFFHNINASALRTAKILYQESSMDELLKLVDMNHQLACDIETGGCGYQNYIHHLLLSAPHVFTTVLGWQNGRESFEDISVTVDAIDVSMDIGVVYRGLDGGSRHRLVSVVCYYGQHYHCFAYNQELARWVMFDDSTVKVVGEWAEVASTCRRGHLQPQVLFYEAVPAF